MSRGSKHITNEDILTATRRLFTQSGYNNVSMRDIAAELGISVGNLTYYYKNKIQLIEAAIVDKHSNTERNPPAKSLTEVDKLLEHTESIQKQHLYYFKQYSQLSLISEAVQDIQKEVYEYSCALWNTTINNLAERELIEAEGYNGQYHVFISTLLFLSAHWHERDIIDEAIGITAPNFKECIWGLLYPMLTAEGKKIYKAEIYKEP